MPYAIPFLSGSNVVVIRVSAESVETSRSRSVLKYAFALFLRGTSSLVTPSMLSSGSSLKTQWNEGKEYDCVILLCMFLKPQQNRWLNAFDIFF